MTEEDLQEQALRLMGEVRMHISEFRVLIEAASDPPLSEETQAALDAAEALGRSGAAGSFDLPDDPAVDWSRVVAVLEMRRRVRAMEGPARELAYDLRSFGARCAGLREATDFYLRGEGAPLANIGGSVGTALRAATRSLQAAENAYARALKAIDHS